MITLKSLKLSGYKSIKDIDPPLEFGNLNVLVGANGSGKSNLLSFFGMLNYLTNESLQKYIAVNGGPDHLLHYGLKKTQQLRAVLEFSAPRGVNRYEMNLTYAKARKETLIFTQESADFHADGEEPNPTPLEMGFGHSESALLDPRLNDGTVNFFKRALKGFRFYQFHDTSAEGPLRRSRNEVGMTLPLYHDGANLAAVLYRLKTDFPEAYGTIIQQIRLAAPFFRDFEFELMPGQGSRGDVNVTWRSEGPDYPLSFHQLSDGTLRFVALVTLLNLPPAMRLDGALLIDEPELGLHPAAIQVLGELLDSASEQTQIVVATQSPVLVSCFQPENVIVAEREGHASVYRRLVAQDYEQWLQRFSLGELWMKNLFGGRPQHE
jgi:predicted ATPase